MAVAACCVRFFEDYPLQLQQLCAYSIDNAWKVYQWLLEKLQVSHLILGFLYFWWSRRQPKKQRSLQRRKESVKTKEDTAKTSVRRSSNDKCNLQSKGWDCILQAQQDDSLETIVLPSTIQERRRFLDASRGNQRKAITNLHQYLQWRYEYQRILKQLVAINSTFKVNNEWLIATSIALQSEATNGKTIPQMAFLQDTDRLGRRILHVTPGRMDGMPLPLFATALAIFIDRQLAADSDEQLTLVIDVRSGIGWPFRNGAQLLPFMQRIIPLLLRNFPGRLGKCIVFPVPPNFEWVWKVVRRVCLDRETANSIEVVTGKAFKVSPPPYKKLKVFVEESIVRGWEERRVASFVTT